MRFVRSSGISGLKGLVAQRPLFIRPAPADSDSARAFAPTDFVHLVRPLLHASKVMIDELHRHAVKSTHCVYDLGSVCMALS